MASDQNLIPAILEATARAARRVESALKLIQEAQASVPAPTRHEVAEMRRGKRPLTPEAFLLASLQRALVDAESLASDLQGLDEEALGKVREFELTILELNALDEAVACRLRRRSPAE